MAARLVPTTAAVTAAAHVAMAHRAITMIDLDNVAFLAKPFSVNKLAEAVRDVLQPK